MGKVSKSAVTAWMFVIGVVLCGASGFSQPAAPPAPQEDVSVTTGTVVSSTADTMIVRTESGLHVLFVFDPDALRPAAIPVGSTVTVTARPDPEGIQVASNVTVTAAAPEEDTSAEPPAVPPEVRRLERQIARQVRRFGVGVRTGVGLDPEVIIAGVHAKLGPFFHRDVALRPNAEFGFGEVTAMVAVNIEGVYRLPITERQSRWSAYIGAGPGFNFIDRNFEAAQAGDRDIDFSDFDFEGSFNILAGVEFRSGMFLELKSTTYSRPHARVLIGYSF